MTTPALVMLVVSLLTLWGGLTASILHLTKHSKEYKDSE